VKFTPHPFQQAGIDHAVSFLRRASPGQRQAYAGPTGVGKSVIELGVRDHFPDLWIVTPREEIIDGLMDKLGVTGDDPESHRISTPVKLRNRLMDGKYRPSHIIFDEAHHHNAETWQQIDLLTGLAPSLAYTATPYRGTPKGTREWIEHWGEPIWVITFKEAVREGYIRLPTFEILPLIDDDIVDINASGDFDVTSLDSATMDRLCDLAEYSKRWYSDRWDRTTVFALPSTNSCMQLQREMQHLGLPTAIISSDTPKSERRTIFSACRERIFALLHINIVSEGVDEPFRRYVDLAPTMSPVNFVQKLGRITRPASDARPEYICTNRNILRHAYALDGMVPVSVVAEGEKLFGPTQRAHTRVLGLEALGRFKPTIIKMLDGTHTYVYAVSTLRDMQVIEYTCLVRATQDPVWACKTSKVNEDRARDWGKWSLCDAPLDIRGFGSVPGRSPSPKQQAWWTKSNGAVRHGIDPEQEVTRKSFQALPVLSDIGGWPRE
jgi:Helicase conserved C-terminal domain